MEADQLLRIPDPPDLVKCLAIIWNIPTTTMPIVGIIKDVPNLVASHDHDDGTIPNKLNGRTVS